MSTIKKCRTVDEATDAGLTWQKPREAAGTGGIGVMEMGGETLRVACLGAGYFAQFHYEAWRQMERVRLVGACDQDQDA